MGIDRCTVTVPHGPHRAQYGPFGVKDCPGVQAKPEDALPPAEALPADDLRDVPPTVLAMVDRTVLRFHELIDGAPLALVVNAYRAGYAHGRQEAAAAIRERVAAYDDATATDDERNVAHGLRTAAALADLPEVRRG